MGVSPFLSLGMVKAGAGPGVGPGPLGPKAEPWVSHGARGPWVAVGVGREGGGSGGNGTQLGADGRRLNHGTMGVGPRGAGAMKPWPAVGSGWSGRRGRAWDHGG